MDNIILRCDNNINGIFTAIYDAFVYKNQMQKKITKYTGTIFLLR